MLEIGYIGLVMLTSLIEVYVSRRLGLFKLLENVVPERLLILLTFLSLLSMQLISPVFFILFLTFIVAWLISRFSRLTMRGKRASRVNIQMPISNPPTSQILCYRVDRDSLPKNTRIKDVWEVNNDVTILVDFSKNKKDY